MKRGCVADLCGVAWDQIVECVEWREIRLKTYRVGCSGRKLHIVCFISLHPTSFLVEEEQTFFGQFRRREFGSEPKSSGDLADLFGTRKLSRS